MNTFEFFLNELRSHLVYIKQNGICVCDGKEYKFIEAYNLYLDRSRCNKKLIIELWKEVLLTLQEESEGEPCKETRKLFIPAIKYLYNLSQEFDILEEMGICKVLMISLCSDSNDFSSRIMDKIIDYRLAIEWINHMIYRDLYICAMMRRLSKASKRKTVEARGIGGPWGRLDLPEEERVFKWDDIDEEIRGRSKDIRHGRRFRMGLEDYNTPNVKEGYYWRELRNEPYAFDDKDSNPYPHRNVLWGS